MVAKRNRQVNQLRDALDPFSLIYYKTRGKTRRANDAVMLYLVVVLISLLRTKLGLCCDAKLDT